MATDTTLPTTLAEPKAAIAPRQPRMLVPAIFVALYWIGWLAMKLLMPGTIQQVFFLFWAPVILALAVLYSIGAHGIMTLNDFKSVEGDQRMGIGSLPVRLGIDNAVRFACVVMGVPQIVVVVMLAAWGRPIHALVVLLLLGAQFLLMVRLLENPRERAPWYNATGTSLYVIGMLVGAFALRGIFPEVP